MKRRSFISLFATLAQQMRQAQAASLAAPKHPTTEQQAYRSSLFTALVLFHLVILGPFATLAQQVRQG